MQNNHRRYLVFDHKTINKGRFYAPDHVQFFRLCHRMHWNFSNFDQIGTISKIPSGCIQYGFGCWFDPHKML